MKKTITINTRMSAMEYKIIAKKAELSDMTVSEYLRQAAIGKQVKGFRLSELKKPEEQIKGQMELSGLL